MATIIVHIQEIESTQVSAITSVSVEKAIWAYAKNAAANWRDLVHAQTIYYPNSNYVYCVKFEFATEELIIDHVYGDRFTALWV